MKRFSAIVVLTILVGAFAAAADGPYHVTNTFKIGLDGGFDYATLDDAGKLLYLTRSTHTIVVDAADGKVVADLAPSKRSHGVALVPELGRGFITDGGAGTVIVFDLKSYAVLGTITAAPDADGIIYDASTKKVLVSCGDAGVLVTISPDVDPKAGKADELIQLGGKPEFLAADGKGKVFVNLVDKATVAVVDLAARKVEAKWPTAPASNPVGLSIDREKGHLFVGCRSKQMIVMSTSDGKILADLPIGAGVDATAFQNGNALASCGDGTLTVIRETSPDKFEVVQTVQTAVGAKTMAVDRATGAVYLPTADYEGQPDSRGRKKAVVGSFKVVVVSEK